MARQIAPGTPDNIEAKQVKVGKIDTTLLDKIADDKIKAANNNFKLYAEALITTESQNIYNEFKNDPVNLANALGKLPDMLSDLPEDVQAQMSKKIALNNISLIGKAQNNYLAKQDYESEQNANRSIDESKAMLSETYQNILQNHISPAEQKNLVMNDIYLQQRINLNDLADLTNSKGKYVYTDAQRKAIRNVDDIQLNGFKQFFDRMVLNDNDKLEQSQEYYTKFMLAPERFMAENYMDRKTYDAAVKYAKKQLKKANADIDKARFNQSVREATELQVANLPGKLESLKESGLIDNKIVNQIEKTNVKFDSIDPSKAESPVAMLDLLSIVNSWERLPENATDAQRLQILAEGAGTLDSIADYAQKYGLNPNSVDSIRRTVVMKEQDAMYGEMLDNFGQITQSFGSEIPDMQAKMNYIRMLGKGSLKGEYKQPSKTEMIKLGQLNEALAVANDMSREAIRNGDMQSYNQIQSELRKRVAQIKYLDKIQGYQWANYENNSEYVFTLPDGTSFQIVGFTSEGDINIKQ